MRGEVVDQCVGVGEHVMHEHGVFADGVVDLGRQDARVGRAPAWMSSHSASISVDSSVVRNRRLAWSGPTCPSR